MHIPPWICFALAVFLASPAHAGPINRIEALETPATRLGKALAGLRERGGLPGSAQFWTQAREIISSADAEKDARADGAAGYAGVMTHANDSIAERTEAPGLKCFDRSEPGRRTVFHFGYKEPLARGVGAALLAFDDYARRYNLTALRSGSLGETSCREAGQ